MKKRQRGFTLIEISLFLALTGALLLLVTIGVQNSISQQRRNDSVQNFAEFLRSVYSEVANVQNVQSEAGRSNKVIYGKLIVFGEGTTLNDDNNTTGKIYLYSVIGDDGGSDNVNAIESLQKNFADVIYNGKFASAAEEYTPRWGAAIQNIDDQTAFMKGAVLIVRHPSSGTINTYMSDETFEINQAYYEAYKAGTTSSIMQDKWTDIFKKEEINFCINPIGNSNTSSRYNIRINNNAHSSSGVEIVSDSGNKCN